MTYSLFWRHTVDCSFAAQGVLAFPRGGPLVFVLGDRVFEGSVEAATPRMSAPNTAVWNSHLLNIFLSVEEKTE